MEFPYRCFFVAQSVKGQTTYAALCARYRIALKRHGIS